MKKRNNVLEVTKRKKKSDDKEELVITYSDGCLSAVGGLSPKELFVFLGEAFPSIIETLISKIEDDEGGKYMKIMLLSIIKSKFEDLLSELEDDSDDDD